MLAMSAAVGAAVGGCPQPVAPPPVSVQEHNAPAQTNEHPYPPRTVILHNLQRVADQRLGEKERVESLRLVALLGGDDPQVGAQLATLLGESGTPESLRTEALDILLRGDYPDLAGRVAGVLAGMEGHNPLKERVLDWLTRHTAPGALRNLVRLWAQERSVTGPLEPRYRAAVETVSGQRWEQALLDGLNSREPFYRGAAVEILAARLPREELRRRVSALTPQADAVAAMHAFLARFDYLPVDGGTLLQSVRLHKGQWPLFDEAARLSRAWQDNYGYRFDIRDFHLLSRLARDPIQKNVTRSQLFIALARSLATRPHVPRSVARPVGPYDFTDRFSKLEESLTIADLWNLHLLDQMLSRSRVQMALRVMAEGDRADRRSAWGGLVFYESGQAEAKLYPPSTEAGENDLIYTPSAKALEDASNCLGRFVGHFEKIENADRAGPTADELRAVQRGDCCLLVLASIDNDSFCAHYANPMGIVVSMGRYSFR